MNGTLADTWRYGETFPFLERLERGMPPAIISLTANGALRGPESSPHIPETAEETASSVGLAYDAGASMVHLHARDPGLPWHGATDPEHWYALHQSVRERCPEIVIMDSTEGDPGMSYDQRTACLAARPEVASFTLAPEMRRVRIPERESHPPRPAVDSEETVDITYSGVERLAHKLLEAGIKPELELKSAGAVQVVRHLIDSSLVEAPYLVQTVLGYPTGNYATVQTVLDLLRDLPDNTLWMCLGKGSAQLPMTTLALLMGGHVRVGLEDNLFLGPGIQGSNAQFVERTARIAGELGRPVATPAETRAMLGISLTPTSYP